MQNLINNTFNRSYNPSSGHNALSNIKRFLTSRDTAAQSKACSYICEVIKRYDEKSNERAKMMEYLLNNDITVFLCEAMSNLDWSLFKAILHCLRLLWRSRSFFTEQHDAHASSGVVRALVHYAGSGHNAAVDCCLHFLCDLLTGARIHEITPPLSSNSAYSTEQLLACINGLGSNPGSKHSTILATALVLQALLAHQTEDLRIRGSTAAVLAGTLEQWLPMLLGTLNRALLKGEQDVIEMFYVVLCQIGVDIMRLCKLTREAKKSTDFVQKILNDDQEVAKLLESSSCMEKCITSVITELVNFTKENHKQLPNEEYGVFLTLLHTYLTENRDVNILVDFSDFLFGNGYLHLLPEVHIARKNMAVRKVSTLVLGEIINFLSKKYLDVSADEIDSGLCEKDIQMGLVELQYGLNKPNAVGLELQKRQSYCLVIYLYFYCQSSENPQDTMSPLLKDFVDHILCLPKMFKPPKYIIKAMWLIFAMSVISNAAFKSLNERIRLERAIEKFIDILQPNPSVYYTHNPALLLWAFTSQRISVSIRICVLSEWLQIEDSLPTDLGTQSMVWDILLKILSKNTNETILENTKKALRRCLEEANDETTQNFASILWSLLPEVLSNVLIDYDSDAGTNAKHILDLATVLIPIEIDDAICLKISLYISTIFIKTADHVQNTDKLFLDYTCLKLCMFLLEMADGKKDSRVLLTYVNRPGFLSSVLQATNSIDDRVACTAFQLLSFVIHYFTNYNYQSKMVLEVESSTILHSLHKDSLNERGTALLQFVYMLLSSGANAPLALSTSVRKPVDEGQAHIVFRGLMFRIQMMCCKESKDQSATGWKTLSAIFKYGTTSKDTKLISTLTTQPWTHFLLQFQLTQCITEEFLTFTNNWLNLSKIIIKRNQEQSKMNNFYINRHSMMFKTLIMLNKLLPKSEQSDCSELKDKVLGNVKELLELDNVFYSNVSQTALEIEC